MALPFILSMIASIQAMGDEIDVAAADGLSEQAAGNVIENVSQRSSELLNPEALERTETMLGPEGLKEVERGVTTPRRAAPVEATPPPRLPAPISLAQLEPIVSPATAPTAPVAPAAGPGGFRTSQPQLGRFIPGTVGLATDPGFTGNTAQIAGSRGFENPDPGFDPRNPPGTKTREESSFLERAAGMFPAGRVIEAGMRGFDEGGFTGALGEGVLALLDEKASGGLNPPVQLDIPALPPLNNEEEEAARRARIARALQL